MDHLTPHPNPDIPLSLVGLLHISTNITSFIFIYITSMVSISGCVSTVSGVYVVHLLVWTGIGMCM